MTRVLVCGGRDYDDLQEVIRVLDSIHLGPRGPISLVIQGMARGADSWGMIWAYRSKVPQLQFPADWKKFGKSAGRLRNQEMLEQGKPDLVVAFPGGYGTADMVRRSREAGVEIMELDR